VFLLGEWVNGINIIMRNLTLIFVLLLTALLQTSCEHQVLNYNKLTAEEIEILYKNGHPELVGLVCEKYFDIYSTTPEEEWLIYGKDYKKTITNKAFFYCQKAVEHGDKDAACYLFNYYRKKIWDKNPDVLNFLHYLQKCNTKNYIKNFEDNDSLILGLFDVLIYVKKQMFLGTENVHELIEKLRNVVGLLEVGINDIKKVQFDLVLFELYGESLINELNILQKRYKRASIQLEHIYLTEVGQQVLIKIEQIKKDLAKFSKRLNDFIEVSLLFEEQLSAHKKEAPPKILDIINGFQKKQSQYFNYYFRQLVQ